MNQDIQHPPERRTTPERPWKSGVQTLLTLVMVFAVLGILIGLPLAAIALP